MLKDGVIIVRCRNCDMDVMTIQRGHVEVHDFPLSCME